ncbi:hypothetical protein AB0J51_03010 [Micromonospora echinofusca]|uniref:hypothetical protein n=1 Tax=Micromonospora echinofusca TaxID=47858 RepID=UPI003414E7C8
MPRLTFVVGLVVAAALLAATLAAGRRPLRRLRALRRAPVGVHPAAPPRRPAGSP